MNIEKYTDRVKGFIQSAQSLAMREGHQQFTPLHILKVLLDDSEGLAGGLIDRAGGNSRAILKATEDALGKMPKVSGAGAGQIYLAPATARAFDAAEQAADKAGDSFVTWSACCWRSRSTRTEAGSLSPGRGQPQNLNAAINALRKGRTADSASAENAYDAAEDVRPRPDQAARGRKLDPVSARDGEIAARAVAVAAHQEQSRDVGEPASARPPSSKGWRCASSTASCRKASGQVAARTRSRRMIAGEYRGRVRGG